MHIDLQIVWRQLIETEALYPWYYLRLPVKIDASLTILGISILILKLFTNILEN